MNGRQAKFVQEYLIDMNATQAAIRAGYSERTAYSQGQRLLKDAEVQEAVNKAKAERLERTHFDQDQVLREVSVLAFSDIRNYVVNEDGSLGLAEGAPDQAMRAVSSVKQRSRVFRDGTIERSVEFRLWDKPAIVKLAAAHFGIPQERVHNFTWDLSQATDEQLERIAAGEDPLRVMGGTR